LRHAGGIIRQFNPTDRSQLGSGGGWRGLDGLAADLLHYGGVIRTRAIKKIGHFYPKVRLQKAFGHGEANVIAWIWARTVASPNPAARGKHVPLMSIRDQGKTPLFRSAAGRTGLLTELAMHRVDAYQMVRRRTAEAGLKGKLGCHVFRATGITAYLEAGGTLENAQAMAAHESPRTTKLYDRTGDEITLDEVERINI
jgi:integrase